jgi:hypothetical protein
MLGVFFPTIRDPPSSSITTTLGGATGLPRGSPAPFSSAIVPRAGGADDLSSDLATIVVTDLAAGAHTTHHSRQ